MKISGIGSIKNKMNGREFVFKSLDLNKMWEIYQCQLDLKIHHNIKLQTDWIKEGKENFEFSIIGEIEDNFLLIEEFEDYLLTSDNYNSVEISDFFIENIDDDLISLLFQVIGKDSCSMRFEEILIENNLPLEYYDIIKSEMISLIEDNAVSSNDLMDKLNDLISEKSIEYRINSLDMQEKLFNELHSITGIGGLNNSFIDYLKENQLSEEIGYKIRENIEELIFLNDVIDNDISKQLESCIDTYHNKINDEIKEKLILKVNQLETDEKFINDLKNQDLSLQNISNITHKLKELISSNSILEENFDEKLDELVELEIEQVWIETKNELINYLRNKIQNAEFENILTKNHLDSNLKYEFEGTIHKLIENREIKSTKQIDLKLDNLLDGAIIDLNKSLDLLLLHLKEKYGDSELTNSFKNKLDNVQLSIDDGVEFVKIAYSEILSYIIRSKSDLENRIDELIFNKNKEILLSQFYCIVGKDQNSESFSDKLKNNYLTEEDGNTIRKDLVNIIDDEKDISKIIDLRNGIELKVEEIIVEKGRINYNYLISLQNELINDLTDIIGEKEANESFKSILYQNNLGVEFWNMIKDEVISTIEIKNLQFDYETKFNQLTKLKNKTINQIVLDIIKREAEIRNYEYDNLKSELISQLNDLIGSDENSDYFNKLLSQNKLDSEISSVIRNEFKKILDADEIYYVDKFNYKYAELLYVKSKTIKELLLELIEIQKDSYYKKLDGLRTYLIDELNSIIGINTILESFKDRLNSYELSEDFAQLIKNEILEVINSNEIVDKQFNSKLNELTELKNNGIDFKIQEIIEREYNIKLDEIKNLKEHLIKDLNEFTSSQNYNNLLKSHNLDSETGIQIKSEINSKINSNKVSDSKFTFKIDELKNINIDHEINESIKYYAKIYNENLSNVRNKLLILLYSIIGKNKINPDFKQKLYNNQLHESFYKDIKHDIELYINSDKIYNEKYEFKLNELYSLNHENISQCIDEKIRAESNLKQKQLDEIRNQLNNEFNNLFNNENNEYYSKLLKENNLNTQTGIQIKSEIDNLINCERVIDEKYQFKLDELSALMNIGLKHYLNNIVKRQRENNNLHLDNIRKNISNYYDSLLSSESFKEKLYKNQIDDSFINVLKTKLDDLINSDVPHDTKFEFKLDELEYYYKNGIEFYIDPIINFEAAIKQKEFNELRRELSDSLYAIIGKEKNTIMFRFKILNQKLPTGFMSKIREFLIDLVSSEYPINNKFMFKLEELNYIKERGLENIINEVIEKEKIKYETNLKEVRERLIGTLNDLIGVNYVKPTFKIKLNSFGLDTSFYEEIKQQMNELICSDNVSNDEFASKLDELNDLENNGIERKIDEIIQIEINREKSNIKEKSLKALYDITGSKQLNEKFIEKLNNSKLNEEFGYKIKNHFESEIDSLSIDDDFDFKKAIDEMICNENKDILLNQTYEIIGKDSDSEYYAEKLQSNMISQEIGNELRNELISQINNSDLDYLIELRDKGIQKVIDDRISTEHFNKQNQKMELKQKLLHELNDYTRSESFKNSLKSKNLDENYGDKIRNEIRDIIRLDKIFGDFEFKIDELMDIDKKGITNLIDSKIDEYAKEIKENLIKLKEELLNDLKLYSNQLSSSSSFGSGGISLDLIKRNLDKNIGRKAIDKLIIIIKSPEIMDSKFETKFDELQDIKNTTVKVKLIEIFNEYAEKQKILIDYLDSKLDSHDFARSVKNYNLSQDISKNVRKDIIDKIKQEKITSNNEIERSISDYLLQEASNQNTALNKLYDIVGSRGISLKFRARLMVNGLSSSDGNEIAKNIENKIRLGKLRVNDVNNEIENEIKSFSKMKKSEKSTSKIAPKYVYCEKCGHKNINGHNFCEQCGSRLNKLSGGD